MTEAEWLRSKNPEAMLDFLGRNARGRKLRLFAAACARRSFAWLPREPRALEVVRTAELLADGQVGRADLQKARRALGGRMPVGLVWTARAKPADAARFWVQVRSLGARQRHADVLREIFGNPFRPRPAVAPAWQTPQVVALAQAAYEERELPSGTLDNSRLAVLADALEEAGCTDGELLGHLRSPGPHVRGCWAVDLLTGRS
jgi:hypothetical protein